MNPFDEEVPLPPEPSVEVYLSDTHDRRQLTHLPAQHRARITWASDIEAEPVLWAWVEGGHGRIPAGSLSVAAGREGTGKSSWALWVAAHLTRGTLAGAFYGQPRKVFYVAVEDSWAHTLVPRLMAAGADLSMVGRFEVVTVKDEEVTLSLPAEIGLLEAAVIDHRAAGVFIDPLISVLGAGIDTHKERDTRSALDPLAKLADKTGAIVCGIAHFGKGNNTDAASLITGSGAFKNVPRTVFGFARDDTEDGGRVMTQVKNSLGRDDLPSLTYLIEAVDVPVRESTTSVGRFAFTGTSDRSIHDILRDTRSTDRDDDSGSGRTQAERFIREYLEELGGSAPAKDVTRQAIQAGFKEADVTKARFRAKNPPIKSERHGFGKGSTITWSIDLLTAIDSFIDSTDSSVQTVESVESIVESVQPLLPVEPPSAPSQCPVCGQGTGWALVSSAVGLVCRRCAPGVRSGTNCVDCGYPRDVLADGR